MAREIKRTDPTGTALSASNGEDGSSELLISSGGDQVARILLHRGMRRENQPQGRRFFSRLLRRRRSRLEDQEVRAGKGKVEFPSGVWVGTDINSLGEIRTEIGLSNGSKIQMAYNAERILSGQVASTGISSATNVATAGISLGSVVVSGGVSQASGFSYMVVDAEGNTHHADTFHDGELTTETAEFHHDTTKKHILKSVNEQLKNAEVGVLLQTSSRNGVVLKSSDGTLVTIRDDGSVRVLPTNSHGSELQVINGQHFSLAAGGLTANLNLDELQVIREKNPLMTIQSDRIINNFDDGSSVTHHTSGENLFKWSEAPLTDESAPAIRLEGASRSNARSLTPLAPKIVQDAAGHLQLHNADGSIIEILANEGTSTPQITVERPIVEKDLAEDSANRKIAAEASNEAAREAAADALVAAEVERTAREAKEMADSLTAAKVAAEKAAADELAARQAAEALVLQHAREAKAAADALMAQQLAQLQAQQAAAAAAEQVAALAAQQAADAAARVAALAAQQENAAEPKIDDLPPAGAVDVPPPGAGVDVPKIDLPEVDDGVDVERQAAEAEAAARIAAAQAAAEEAARQA
ncbi:MAG: hypothetical protein EBU43_08115, partial [Actinobacteria bacterium]|nr:hypothetical protein [Actinomycetota bacterium]